MVFVSFFVGACIVQLCCLYTWNRLIKKKVNFKSYKTYIIIIFLALCSTLLTFFTNTYIKMVAIALIMIIVYYYFIYKKLNYAIISILLVQTLFMIIEGLFVFVVSGVFHLDMNKLFDTAWGVFAINSVITLGSFLVIFTGILDKVFNQILKVTNCIHSNKMSKYTIWMILFAVLLTNFSYSKISPEYFLIISILIVLIYFFAIYKMASSQNRFEQINKEYFKTKKSFEEYENMMDKYHIMNHEMKNEFRTVRAMVINKEKNIDKYIDLVIDEKIEDKEKLMRKMYKIPNDFLRGTLYSEILKMEDLSIKYNFHISRNVKTSKLLELEDELSFDICNILAVFLDNAIECVKDLDKKEVSVGFYLEDNILNIEISNNFCGEIPLDSISNPRYTTKGAGHGYGLSFVKQIVDKNKNIENERLINKNRFTQILKIKM